MKNIYKKIISVLLIISIISTGLFVPVQNTKAFFLEEEGVGEVNFKDIAVAGLEGYAYCWLSNSLSTVLTDVISEIIPSSLSEMLDKLSVPTNGMGTKSTIKKTTNKECGLDFMANKIKKKLVNELIGNSIKWLKGSLDEGDGPKFMLNPKQFLWDVTDEYVNTIIGNDDSKLTKALCSNFSLSVKQAISLEFYGKNGSGNRDDKTPTIPTCTMENIAENISDVSGNLNKYNDADGKLKIDDFMRDLVEVNSNPNNNAFGAYINLSDSLKKLIGEKTDEKKEDVKRGNGFMSIERCEKENVDGKEKKTNCSYVTPGRILSDEIAGVLGMERKELEMADEFDEILQLLISRVMDSVFNKDKGILGVTDDDSDIESRDLALTKATYANMYDIAKLEILANTFNGKKEVLDQYIKHINEGISNWNDATPGNFRITGPDDASDDWEAAPEGGPFKLLAESKESALGILNAELQNRERERDGFATEESKTREFMAKAEGARDRILEAETVNEIYRIVEEVGVYYVGELEPIVNEHAAYIKKTREDMGGTGGNEWGTNGTIGGFACLIVCPTLFTEEPDEERFPATGEKEVETTTTDADGNETTTTTTEEAEIEYRTTPADMHVLLTKRHEPGIPSRVIDSNMPLIEEEYAAYENEDIQGYSISIIGTYDGEEASGDSGSAVFTIKMSPRNVMGVPLDGMIEYGGTATPNVDFIPIYEFSIPSGEAETQIRLKIKDDSIVDDGKNIVATITEVSDGIISDGTAQVNITDNDTAN